MTSIDQNILLVLVKCEIWYWVQDEPEIFDSRLKNWNLLEEEIEIFEFRSLLSFFWRLRRFVLLEKYFWLDN